MTKKTFASVILGAFTAFAVVAHTSMPALAVTSVTSGVQSAKGDEQPANLFGSTGVFSTITNVLLFIVGAVAVIMIVIGGLRYVISGGDSSQVQAAKNTILYALIGVIIAILAYAAVNFVVSTFIPQSVNTGNGGVNGTSTR